MRQNGVAPAADSPMTGGVVAWRRWDMTMVSLNNSSRVAALVLAAIGAGCGTADPDFDRVMPEDLTEEERTAAVLAALFNGQMAGPDGSGEFAALDALVGSAHADGPPFNYCVDHIPPVFASMSGRGSSGYFGSAEHGVTLDANRNFCQNRLGETLDNSNNTQYKQMAVTPLSMTCNWGLLGSTDYSISGSGAMQGLDWGDQWVHGSFSVIPLNGLSSAVSADCSMHVQDLNGGPAPDGRTYDIVQEGSCSVLGLTLPSLWRAFDVSQYCHLSSDAPDLGPPPTASCGPDISAFALDTVNLSAAGSTDPMGGPLSYSWSLTRPDGSSTSLSDITSSTPSMFLDVVGTYRATATVMTARGTVSTCTQNVVAEAYEDFRVELSWTIQDDLDLHLLNANPRGIYKDKDGGSDCYYANCQWGYGVNWGYSASHDDDARLDLDDIWGLGPENININDPSEAHPGWYTIAVHDYYGTANNYNDNPFTVKVYVDGNLARTWNRTASGENLVYWMGQIQWPGGTVADCSGTGSHTFNSTPNCPN